MGNSNLLSPRRLGADGPSVGALALGSVKFGRNRGLKYSEGFELPSTAELDELLAVARAGGLNLIDTAPAYGSAEQRLGPLLESDSHWLVSTKVGESFDGESSSFDFSRAGVIASLENSRRHLRRDCLDVVLLHCSDDDLADLQSTPALETLAWAQSMGWVRQFGASVKSIAALRYALEICSVTMCSYSLDLSEQLRRRTEEALELALTLNRGVLVKKALGSGQSSDPAAALRFASSHPATSSVVIGTINPTHLKANISALQPA